MKKKSFIYLFIGLICVSCTKNVNQAKDLTKSIAVSNPNPVISHSSKSDSSSKSKNSITIKTFTIIPQEIDGCGCSFFLSQKDKKEEKYICVNDFASLAFMMINGKMTKFMLTEHKDNSDTYKYKSEELTLIIKISKNKPNDYESSDIEGLITIRSSNALKEISFIGTCGC